MQSPSKESRTLAVLPRGAYLLAALIGSYGVIWALTGFAAVSLARLGLERSEAVIFSTLLGFVLYPALVLVLIATRRPLRLWAVLAAVGLLGELLGRTWGAR
ncbi:MAG: hypothetical protein V4812_20715 [Pseudomonadota bacterium]